MQHHLIVTADFADFKRGDRITDPELVEQLPQGSNHANVVRVVAPKPEEKTVDAEA